MIPTAGLCLGSVVLEHPIAEGGMGTIWAATHTELRRQVAVKFAADTEGHADAWRRLEQEGETLSRVRSAYVPQFFGEGKCPDGMPFFVMELLGGTDLAAWITRFGVFDVDQAARLLQQVGWALGSAHRVGVVHRDVKPTNLLLTGGPRDFEVKLIDFGIAKAVVRSLGVRALTQEGIALGSAGYMSPEQLVGARDIDARSDLWSLAVVAYFCLTARLPFAAETFGAMCLLVHRGHFVPVSELRPDLPARLDEWFDRALAHEASRRFRSADVMTRMFRVAAVADVTGGEVATWSLPPPPMETDPTTQPRTATTNPCAVENTARVPPSRGRPRVGRLGLALGAGALGFISALALAETSMFRSAGLLRGASSPAAEAVATPPAPQEGVAPPDPTLAPLLPGLLAPREPRVLPSPRVNVALAGLASHPQQAASRPPHVVVVESPPVPSTWTWLPTDELGEAGERAVATPP